jgi:hypothetical protein
METNAALQSLLTGLNAALKAHIRPDTGLFDPLDHKPSPPDHYGHVCAALALACAGKQHWDTGRLALQAWLDLPPDRLGHLPFNRLALLLLREVLGAEGLVAADAQRIDAGLRRCTLRRRYPSNNWSLLAQTCRLIEASPANKAHECRRLCALLERWTTPKGCFIDFPENPGKHFSTPIAYHHKALFLTSLACWFHDDEALTNHARRLCDWLVHCWDPAGYAGGFGRSTHSLFGDGCLIAGLILLDIDKTDPQPIAALSQRIVQQRRSDGLLWLNPAGHESGTASWDSYMHLSVYNAWAAAVVGAALHLQRCRDHSPARSKWSANQTGWFHDDVAGLGCLRTASGMTAVISTHGQPPQAYSRDEADLRYAGGIVVHLNHPDYGTLVSPPTRVGRAELERHPELAGWTPLFRTGNELFGLTDFERISASLDGHRLQIVLEGNATAVFRPAPTSVWQRVKSAIDWRYLGGRVGRMAVLHRRKHLGIQAKLRLSLATTAASPILGTRLVLFDAPEPETIYLNPQGRTWPGPCTPSGADAEPAYPYPSSLPGGRATCQPPAPLRPGRTEWTSHDITPTTSEREPANPNDAQ